VPMLSGLRVLIVEDEPVLSDDLSEIITAAEGLVVGPASECSAVRGDTRR
jgi:hypothetical protein